MKKALLIVLLLAVAGVAASLWLLPNIGEVALMNLRDKKYDEALTAYEGQIQKGDTSPETVGRTVDLYLKAGKIDDAIRVMEDYVAKNPNNVNALERLGSLYQFAQRPDDYMKNLERIDALAPSEKNKQILSSLYNARGQYEKQLEIMLSLVETDKSKTPDYYRDIASLQAAQKEYGKAIATLRTFKVQHPAEFAFPQTELLVSLLMDSKQFDSALAEAQEWAKRNPPPEDIARLTSILHYKGAPQQALTFIEPYAEQAKTNTDLLTELASVYAALSRKDEAYALLSTLYKEGKLPPVLFGTYVELLVARGEKDEVRSFVSQIDPQALTESQAIYLVELADSQSDATLMDTLNTRFGTEEYLSSRPVLAAVLALANKAKNADELVAKAEAQPELTNQQLMQLSQACARAGKKEAALRLATTLSAREGLTDADIAGIGDVYLLAGDYEAGLAFLASRRNEQNTLVLDPTWVRLASAAGKNDDVVTWLDTNAKSDATNGRLLRDVYFLSLEHGNTPITVKAAELMYEKEQSGETRSYLGTAYVRNGQFDAAIPLLRDARGESEAAENMYIEALGNAGESNAEFKAELEDYLAERLDDKKLSDKRKQQLLYALLDQGRADLALPHIRSYAMSRGGSWGALYEETLTKQGRRGELRDYWLAVAQKSGIPAKRKREVGFSLLNAGYKADAVTIFQNLADASGPTSPDTRQLLYLWGPRPSAEALAWLEKKAAAGNGADRKAWLKHLANYNASDAVVRIVRADPSVMNDPDTSKLYLEALAATLEKSGDPAQLKAELEKQIATETNPQTLAFYGELAQRHYLVATARQAYAKLLSVDANNAVAHKRLGILAFTQSDFSEAKKHLAQFMANRPAQRADDDYLVPFYYAEALNHDRARTEAQRYYMQTLEDIDASGNMTPEKESVAAQAKFRIGEQAEAYSRLDALVAKYPGNRTLRADYASVLIDGKQYDKAREILAGDKPTSNPAAGGTSRALLLDGAVARDVAVSRDGREVVVTLAKPAEKILAVRRLAQQTPDYLNYATVGYDQVLLVAADGKKLDAAQTSTGVEVIAQDGKPVRSALLESQTDLRMELLSARIDLETGNQFAATERLATLEKRHPNDPQLLGYSANAEYYVGRWASADQKLQQAAAVSPENEDIAILQRDIDRVYGPQVRLDHEWRMIGKNDEQITTLSAQGYLDRDDYIRMGVRAQNDFVDSSTLQRSDGRIGKFSSAKQRGEIWVSKDMTNGTHLQGAIYGNEDTVGAGFEYGLVSSLGITTFGLEYHKPYWEFVEAVLGDATRDRVGVAHTARITPTVTASGSAGYNNYNVDTQDDTVQTATVTLNLVKALKAADPYFAVAYGLDGEYRTGSDDITETSIILTPFPTLSVLNFDPLPLDTREVHTLSILSRYDFSPETYIGGQLGYAYDRYGGDGPLVEAYLNHIFNDTFEAGLRAYHGLGVGDTNDDYTRLGGHLMMRF